IFELEVVSSGGGSHSKIFSSKSFVRIRHRNSAAYLSSRRLLSSSVSTLEVADHANLEDTVTVLMVPRKRQQELCYLIGNVEFLSSYIKMFYTMQDPHCQLRPQDPLVTRVVQRAAASLAALTCFCTDSEDDDPLTREGLPIPTHQQSMFEVQLHRIVMEVLLCPFVSATKENKLELPLEGGVLSIKNLLDDKLEHVHRVCRLCYRLLKQMSKASPHAWQLVEYVAFMQAQEGYKLHVADTQLEIFTNNSSIPQERCEANIRHFVSLLLTKERSSGYLRFLSSLCVVKGSGVVYNQSLVSRLLLQDHAEKILYPTKLSEDGQLMVFIPPPPQKKKKPLESIQASPIKKVQTESVWLSLPEFLKTGEPKMIKFFESSIELLGNLCIGSDPACLAAVQSYMTQGHISAAIDPEFSCSDFLRSSYFTLALHLFTREILSHYVVRHPKPLRTCGSLVRAPAASLAIPSNSLAIRSSSSIASGTSSLGSPWSVGTGFSTFNEAEQFLQNVKSKALVYVDQLREKEVGTAGSDLVLVLSHIWHSIVMHGAYTHEELVEAVHAVIRCLDTTNVAKNPERYKRSEDTENAMRMKLGLCKFLLTVLEHELRRVTDLVLVDLAKDEDGASATKVASVLVQELRETFLEDRLLGIVTDIMYYENKDLVAAAVEIVHLLRNAPGLLATRVGEAEIVKVEATRCFDMFFKVQRDFDQNLSPTGNIINEDALITCVRELTLFDPTEDKQGGSGRVSAELERRSSIVNRDDDDENNDEQEELQQLRTAASAARIHRSMSSILRRGAAAVIASNRLTAAAMDKRSRWRRTASNLEEYARLLFKSHLHMTLVRILKDEDTTLQLHQILLEFFRVLCVADVSASALGAHISVFVPFLHVAATQPDAAAIVLRVVEVNPWLADQLDEQTVVQLTNILLLTKEPSIAEGLEHATLGEYPVSGNQNIVAAALIDARIVDRILPDGIADKTAQQLGFRSACVNLLSCCCVNNASCRSLIAQAVSVDGIIEVLEQSAMPSAHLVPYYKLLASGFLSTEDDLTAQELHQKRRVWADHGRWWKLLEGRVFSLLNIDEETDNVDPDLLFLGVIPVLNAFYTHLFGAVPCSKSKVAIPLTRVVRRISQFTESLLKSSGFARLTNENRIGSLLQLMMTLSQHMDAKHEMYTTVTGLQEALRNHKTRLAAAATEKKNTMHHPIPGSAVFADWGINNEDSIRPLLTLWSGDDPLGALYRCGHVAANSRLKQLHELLVEHLAAGVLSDAGATFVMATFRFSITQFENDTPKFIEAQNYVNSIGALKMITETACNANASSSEAFSLAIAVLEGGNTAVQDHLLNFFTSTDERFFHEVSAVIQQATRRAAQKRAREAYLSFYAITKSRPVTFGTMESILRFLQLMCEGHHLGLQDYLREQQDNLRSVNVVKDIILFLIELALHDVFAIRSFSLMLQCLNALTEFCQGPCIGNQKLIVSTGGCQCINTILTHSDFAVAEPYEGEEVEQLMQLKRSAVTLLLALLEGNTDDSIATAIMSEIPMSGLSTLTNQLIETKEFTEQTNEDICEVVYSLMISAHTLVNTTADGQYRSGDMQGSIDEAKRMLDKNSSKCGLLGKIEIERHERIERVYFRVPTICSLLTEEAREKLIWSLDRSTQGSKLSDFLDKVDEMIYDMEVTDRVRVRMTTTNLLFRFCTRWPLSQWDDMSLLVAVIMNLLFVVVMEDAQGLLDKSTDWLGVEGLIRLCAYTQLVISIVAAFLDGSLNFPLILYKQSKKHGDVQLSNLTKVLAIGRRNETLYRFSNVIFAVMGFFFSDFFFAFHLLGLITKSSVLKNVIVAVTTNGKSLLLTGMLGCILVYLFSIIAFVMFQDHFDNEACSTLNNCVLHILTGGLRQGGGIGDAMKSVSLGQPYYLRRTLYDFLFWAIMIVIFLNILFGIIIDTFAELRDDKSKKEEDMRTKCLVCGIDSYTFDRYGTGFHEHIKKEHNMWQYLYFIHHLRRKESTEYTGQESYVAVCVAKGDISFFPAGKCSSLKNIPISGAEDGSNADGADDVNGGDSKGRVGAVMRRQPDGSLLELANESHTHRGAMAGLDGSFAGSIGGLAVDHGATAVLMANSEQTVSALSRVIQRLDSLEKSSLSLMFVGSGAAGGHSSSGGGARIHRLESNLSTRSGDASPLPARDAASRTQMMEADHTYQLHLAYLKQEQETRQQRLYHAMSVAFESFSAHHHVVQSLFDAFSRSKAELFASTLHTHVLSMCARIHELTRFGDMLHSEIVLVQQEHAKQRESTRLDRMIQSLQGVRHVAASPLSTEDSSSPTSPPNRALEPSQPRVEETVQALMQKGHDYMMLLRQMTSEGRAAHAASGSGFTLYNN
ncbi:inositol 1,4,5-trisphosphate/ryanodine receptor, putative, partial [Bodo saltans]